jgi:hypothetical protein
VIVPSDADGVDSCEIPFESPVTEAELKRLKWYVEVYPTFSLGDPDDAEASEVVKNLPIVGKKLFSAVFCSRDSEQYFYRLRDSAQTLLITILSDSPAILRLPWELLHEPRAHDGSVEAPG